ncbi:MAG: HD domain-containing protein [Calditrichaeota bacterium]|nr:HD domain-containing protein [Calditrichota bacterium]MCB9391822.1 HD domain-containing protein [Calditrichota bacterium]
MSADKKTERKVLRRTDSRILERIGALADERGLEVYAVGGFIRDRLLGKKVKDIDFTVIGDAVSFARAVAELFGVRNPVVFERFGTAMVPYRGHQLDFVTARAESYESQSRKPRVWEGALDDDLARRDFTVNALAASLNGETYGKLVDHYDGMGDLERKVLRTPKEPEQTFSEDPLRIMRAVRFAAQLEFEIAPHTLAACKLMAPRLKIVSQERITDELMKLLSAAKPSIGLRIMQELGVMEIVFREISDLAGVDQIGQHHHKDVFDHTLLVVDRLAELTPDPVLRLAALVHDIAKPKTKRFFPDQGWTFHGHEDVGSRMMKPIGRRMKLPEKTTSKLMKLTALHMRPINLTREEVTDSAVRRLIVDAGDDLDELLMLCRADITSANPRKVKRYLTQFEKLKARIAEVIEGDQLRAFQSPVRGDEIMQICNLQPGPAVGKIKTALEEAILEGRVANEHDAVLQYLLEIKDQFLES